jgi:glucose-6-phosphate dehydrogenase assembly protein OpcA
VSAATPPGVALTDARSVDLDAVEAELARLWRAPETSGPATTRACTSNLIVFCASRAEVEACQRDVPEIVRQHPARVLLLVADPEAASALEASVSAFCYPAGRGARFCSEYVVLRAGGDAAQRLPSAVRPLLVGDLPTTLWWTPSDRSPPDSGKLFAQLDAMADQVIYESRGWHDPVDAIVATTRWAADAPRGKAISDLAWRRLEAWRRLVACALDPGVVPGALRGIREVSVEHGPHALPKAWMFVAWLAGRLGWRPVRGRLAEGREVGWGFASPSGPVEVRVSRRGAGDAELERVAVHWSGGSASATRSFERLGPGRLGVTGDAVGERPAVVATLAGERSALVARALPARGGHSLFREALEVGRGMAGVLER